jgi:hypothetical protein
MEIHSDAFPFSNLIINFLSDLQFAQHAYFFLYSLHNSHDSNVNGVFVSIIRSKTIQSVGCTRYRDMVHITQNADCIVITQHAQAHF